MYPIHEISDGDDDIDDDDDDMDSDQDVDLPRRNRGPSYRRAKRRVTRAVRPTMRKEFPESDGQQEGKVVFELTRENEFETFKIRDENPWVTGKSIFQMYEAMWQEWWDVYMQIYIL